MKRFIIHVGPHKTGSSYLQEGLARSRAELEARGIFYPNVWGPKAHHRLLERLFTDQRAVLEAEFSELRRTPHDTIVISVEGLTSLAKPEVEYFKHLLGDANVRIVFYARSWADVLLSHWKEEVKAGRLVLTFPEYICERVLNPRGSYLINFGHGLGIYEQVFGGAAISIAAYDEIIAEGLDLFDHFVKTFVGVGDLPDPNLQRVNVGLGTVDTEVIRTLNGRHRSQRNGLAPPMHAAALRDRYLAIKGERDLSLLTSAIEQHQSSIRINETVGPLYALHRELFAEFQHALVPPRPGRLFFEPRVVDVTYTRPDYLLIPGVLAQLETLYLEVSADLESTAPTGSAGRPHPMQLEPTSATNDANAENGSQFESLGENCEFGLVQRRCGIEPLGLLRFSSTPLPPLLKALRARFAGMGRPEFIEIEVSHSGTEYMVFDKRFHFRYHAWVKLGEQAPEEIHARECRRLPLLVRKLIEDLTEGNKIFVYRGIEPLAEAQARELAEAIGAYGPGTLLWVERADAANPPGAVIRLGPTLLKGHIDRFAPPENAHDLSLDCWIAICRNALALTRATVAA